MPLKNKNTNQGQGRNDGNGQGGGGGGGGQNNGNNNRGKRSKETKASPKVVSQPKGKKKAKKSTAPAPNENTNASLPVSIGTPNPVAVRPPKASTLPKTVLKVKKKRSNFKMTKDLKIFWQRWVITRLQYNSLVDEFYANGCIETQSFYQKILKLIAYANINTDNVFLPTMKHPTILYNLAVQHYHFRSYTQAETTLRRLMAYKNGPDQLSRRIRLLLINLLITEHRLEEALLTIESVEASMGKLKRGPKKRRNSNAVVKKKKRKFYMLPSDQFELDVRFRLQQKKTECVLLARLMPAAKYEYKKYEAFIHSMPKGQSNLAKMVTVQAHLKAYLECLRGHPLNALTILKHLSHGANPLRAMMCNERDHDRFMKTGDNLTIILSNNAACCFHAMSKPLVASWHMTWACAGCDNVRYKNRDALPLHCQSYNIKYHILYNYGLTCLKSGDLYGSFYYFWLTSRRVFKRSPRLWLHMAQCCVHIFERRRAGRPCSEEQNSYVFEEFKGQCPNTNTRLPFAPGCTPPLPTVEFGLRCIYKALNLIRPGLNKKKFYISCPPGEAITNRHALSNLHATILITGSFLALVHKYSSFVINSCEQILEMSDIPRVYRCLAKMYLATALRDVGEPWNALKIYHLEGKNSYDFTNPPELTSNPAPPLTTSRSGRKRRSQQIMTKMDRHYINFRTCRSNSALYIQDAFIFNQAFSLARARSLNQAHFIIQEWLYKASLQGPRSLSAMFQKLGDILVNCLKQRNEKKMKRRLVDGQFQLQPSEYEQHQGPDYEWMTP